MPSVINYLFSNFIDCTDSDIINLILFIFFFSEISQAIKSWFDCVNYVYKNMDYSQAFLNLTNDIVKQMVELPDCVSDSETFNNKHIYLLCRVKRLLRFIDANKEINSEMDLDRLLEMVVEKATQIMRADYGAIALIDKVSRSIHEPKVRGILAEQADVFLKSSILQPVCQKGISIRIADVAILPPLPFLNEDKIAGALLAVPIIGHEAVIGALFIGNRPAKTVFSEEDESLMIVFASQAFIAIEKALLHGKVCELALLHERQRMAEALHDTVVQNLFTIGLNARLCLQNPNLDSECEQRLHTIRRLSSRSNCELRSAIYALKSPFLGKGDTLIELLTDLVNELQAQTGIACRLILPNNYRTLHVEASDAIYRIVCESLNNIAKHSYAKTAIVSINCDDENFTVIIQDDGIGLKEPISLEYDPKGLHFGVMMMKQYVDKFGGEFTIMNTDDQGVMVRAHFPGLLLKELSE